MYNTPFEPTGPTHLITAAADPPTGVLVGNADSSHYMLYNPSDSDPIWVAMSAIDGAAAEDAAIIPLDSAPQSVIPLPPGALIVVSGPLSAYISGVGGSSLPFYATPGRGL